MWKKLFLLYIKNINYKSKFIEKIGNFFEFFFWHIIKNVKKKYSFYDKWKFDAIKQNIWVLENLDECNFIEKNSLRKY